ncbi:MAG: phosphotransferase, partial [Oscillospiraceae bacterium]|nr:phosphotransferase [Oscillospiraceae bacterium]
MQIAEILETMGIFGAEISAFKNEEDGDDYAVWKLSTPENTLVLKKAKEYELEIYESFLSTENDFAPKLYKTARTDDGDYLLMEYVPGETLIKCTREKLILALDALISMQKSYWKNEKFASCGRGFEKSLEGRINRGKYLNDAELERTYKDFLEIYRTLPRTLCHDDFLPFNVIASEEKAVIIDWEVGGILPYPVSFARFIAHAEEKEDAFFYMTDKDKTFAVEYYYDKLLKEKDISYEEYIKAL